MWKLGLVPLVLAVVPAVAHAHEAAGFSPGTYWTRIRDADVADPAMKVNVGTWQLVFTDQQGYRVYLNGEKIGEGSYTIAKDKLVIADNAKVCQGLENGNYQWSGDGRGLSLKLIEDRCSHRALVLTLGAWKRQAAR